MSMNFTVKRLPSLLFLTGSLFCNASIAADYILQNDRWSLLTVPANSSTQTIEQLFGDDLPAATYEQEWALYRFDAATQEFVKPTLQDTLPQGSGFWMVQRTGTDVTIDLPADLTDGEAQLTAACASTEGCFSTPLPTSDVSATWSLLGAPFKSPVDVTQIRVSSSDGTCAGGCDLDQAKATGLLRNDLWVYNSVSGNYEKLTSSNDIAPWQGFWVQSSALPDDTNLTLHLPKPADPPQTGIQAVCPASVVAGTKQITNNQSMGTSNLYHSYSKRQAVNADETKLVLTSSNTVIYDIVDGDAVNPKNINLSSEVMWSELEPDILFGTQYSGNFASKLVAHNVTTDETVTLFDVQQLGLSPSHSLTVGDYEGHIQQDRYVVLRMSGESTGTDKLISLDLSTTPATVLGELDTPSEQPFNWAGFSPDGKTIVSQSGAADAIYSVHNADLSFIVGPNVITPGSTNFRFAHMDWVSMPNGESILVAATDQNNSVFNPRLDSWTSLETTISLNGISNSGHISGLASKQAPGIYLASDTFPNQDSYIVKLKGEQDISIDWFINIGEIWGGRENYVDQTKATISPTGKYIIYNRPVAGVAQTFLMTMDNSACPTL